jgi:hypothetical protein
MRLSFVQEEADYSIHSKKKPRKNLVRVTVDVKLENGKIKEFKIEFRYFIRDTK